MARGNDTYAGALAVLAKQIAGMMGLADGNLPFCQSLLDQVTAEMRSPEIAMQEAGILPRGVVPGMESPSGPGMGGPVLDPMALSGGGMAGPGGMSAPPPSLMGEGNPGMATAPSSNPDELRRIMQGAGAPR